MSASNHPLRVLILSPFGKDAVHLCKILDNVKIVCSPCKDIAHLLEELKNPVGAIITTQEMLHSKDIGLVKDVLKNQPKWSAVPILAFYSPSSVSSSFHGRPEKPVEGFDEVVFVQRPISATTLISTVRNSLRDRARQYRMKELLAVLAEDIAERAIHATELKAAHLASREAEISAQNANSAKSEFLANMSHEIRTPLCAIMGYASLIREGSSFEQIFQFANVIERNSHQLTRLIDDILDLSKVEAGQMTLESVEFSLPELMWDVSSLLSNRATEKGIGFSLKAAGMLPEKIISDPVRVRQILFNAVGNAIKFTDIGHVDVKVYYAKEVLRIEVSDTGRGISEEQSRALFQAFVQADASTTRKYGGTGLGLVLTRNICKTMGGNFTLLKSELGRGSTFVAEIRVQASNTVAFFQTGEIHSVAPTVVSCDLNVGKPLAAYKILLVEDSLDNQMLFKILLTRAGARVDVASNGEEGVKMALRGGYSVVLMDLQMPVMGGLEAVRLLRDSGFKTPVVALTAHAMKDEGGYCFATGFSDFLTKPLDRKELLRALTALNPDPASHCYIIDELMESKSVA